MRRSNLTLWSLGLLLTLTVPAGATLEKIGEIPCGDGPYELDFFPDGSLAYVVNRDVQNPGQISVIELATGATIDTVNGGSRIYNVRISPDGTRAMAMQELERSVLLIDATNHTVLAEIDEDIDEICWSAAFTPDNARAFVTGQSKVFVIDVASATVETTLNIDATEAIMHPDGTEVWFTGVGGNIEIYDPVTLGKTGTINASGGRIDMTPDGTLAVLLDGSNVRLIDAAARSLITTVSVEGNSPMDAAISYDGSTAIVGYWRDFVSPGYDVTVIDIPSQSVVANLNNSPDNTAGWLGIQAVGFAPDILRGYSLCQYFSRMDVFGPAVAYQPDLQIKQAGVFVGDDIYNTDGTDQTAARTVGPGSKAVYKAQLFNDGDEDTFWIQGPASNDDWTIRYYKGTKVKASKEITTEVTGAGWASPTLETGQKQKLVITVKPKSTATGTLQILVTATSDGDPSQQDAIGADTTVLNVQPDLWIKHTGKTWLGDDVYNGNGKDQTKRKKKQAGVLAQYKVRLVNDGDETETFFIKAPGASEGWTVEYIKGSKDVTAEVTSAEGWERPNVPPGKERNFQIRVTSSSGLGPGESLKLLVRAEAQRDSKQRDAVKAVTVVVE